HVEGFTPDVFWIEKGGNDVLPERLALRPTSEALMYTMYAEWIRSHRDLPMKIYQEAQVWRYETKHTRPLLRDREFYWIEAHNCFAEKNEAEKQVLEDIQTTERVLHEQLALPFFSFKRPAWDTFNGAVYTVAADVIMPNGIVIQQPSTHFLGQKFSKAYGIKFIDKNEKEDFVWQTCYGPAVSRILGSVIAMHGDNRGLIFPWSVAPYQVVIIPIIKKDADNKKTIKHCVELKSKLQKAGVRVELDDSEKTPGNKYYQWELRGACLRIEIGPKELDNGELTIARRDSGEKKKIKEKDLEKYLEEVPHLILKNLRERADKAFENCVHDAKTMKELKKYVKDGGFTRVNFCSRDEDGRACAETLKAETGGGEVRGTLHGKEETPNGPCVVCGKKAGVVVYVANPY
ncbi:proline--tRNA ligase, partial [Candidatus Micrarchaeota archaeon]|nr:proline--tRNA ligase [Candidatus Micrarchaeota archaeon]